MDLTFILLTVCLTLAFIEIKGFKSLSGFLNGVGVVDSVSLVQGSIQDKELDVMELLDLISKDAEKLSFGLSNEMTSVNTQVMDSSSSILNEIQINEINKIMVKIYTSTEHLGQIVDSYHSNKTFMVYYVVELIKYLQLYSHESTLVELLDIAIVGSKSLVDTYIERSKQHQRQNKVSFRTSTNKMVREFFTLMMLTVEKGHSLLDLCYSLKAFYLGMSYPSDEVFLNKRKKTNIDKLLKSWEYATKKTEVLTDFYSYSNLVNDVEYVRFKKLLQTQFLYEKDIKNNCRGSCKNITQMRSRHRACKGEIYYCYDVLGMFEVGTVVFSTDPTRIYERYSIGDTWYGRHGMTFAGRKEPMLNAFISYAYCDHCRCTCDQVNDTSSVRSLYIGKVHPQQEKYVITGVRFSEHNKTIYLEIQVGQLLPMGFIKPSTIHWEGPPIDININVVRYDFNFRMFYLDFIKVKTGFLSGFEFYRTNDTFRLRTYSKKFTNFTIGTVSDKEEIQVDNDVYKIFKLQDRIPNMLKTKGKIDTKYNKTIMFGPSNQEADAGQSMVPYFDATDITFDLKTPLAGIGFFHHTNHDRYAGYIRPFILSLNYSDIAEV